MVDEVDQTQRNCDELSKTVVAGNKCIIILNTKHSGLWGGMAIYVIYKAHDGITESYCNVVGIENGDGTVV